MKDTANNKAVTASETTLNQRLATRISQLRSARALSLDALAEQSGVSRSMISLIERGEANATAVILDKLAASLGVTLASLFVEPAAVPTSPILRKQEQSEWMDPESGYLRRNLTPGFPEQPMQLVEVFFPAGKRVTFDHHQRQVNVHEQIWILEGSMQITLGHERWTLKSGDCLALKLESTITFFNPTRKPARYLVVRA